MPMRRGRAGLGWADGEGGSMAAPQEGEGKRECRRGCLGDSRTGEEACDQRSGSDPPRDVTSSLVRRGGANLQQKVRALPDQKASPATTPEGILAAAFRERKRTYKQTAGAGSGSGLHSSPTAAAGERDVRRLVPACVSCPGLPGPPYSGEAECPLLRPTGPTPDRPNATPRAASRPMPRHDLDDDDDTPPGRRRGGDPRPRRRGTDRDNDRDADE